MLRQTMNLRHLLIRNFRGIQHLDWAPGGKAICLIGAGDSTKTTILDAIEWSLSPRWSLPVSDADFHGAITDESIVVEATVGQVPGALLSDQKYGLDQRGWGLTDCTMSRGTRTKASSRCASRLMTRLNRAGRSLTTVNRSLVGSRPAIENPWGPRALAPMLSGTSLGGVDPPFFD